LIKNGRQNDSNADIMFKTQQNRYAFKVQSFILGISMISVIKLTRNSY